MFNHAPNSELAGILGGGAQGNQPQFAPVRAGPMPAMRRGRMTPLQPQRVAPPSVPQPRPQETPGAPPVQDPRLALDPASAASMQPAHTLRPNIQAPDTGPVSPLNQPVSRSPSFMDLLNQTAGGWSPVANLGFPFF